MKKSVIVPVYNEEGNIGNLILKIKTVLNNNDELIIVNDGSSDKTLNEIQNDKCILINLNKNMGKGYAMRKGIESAQGDYIVFMGFCWSCYNYTINNS